MHISQLIRYSRACGAYHDILYRGLLLTRKLLNQRFIVFMLNSSLRKVYDRHHDFVNRYVISITNDHMYFPCFVRNHNPVLSQFMTYYEIAL